MRKSDDEKSVFAETVAYYIYLAYTVSLCLDTCKTRIKLNKPFKLTIGTLYDASKRLAPLGTKLLSGLSRNRPYKCAILVTLVIFTLSDSTTFSPAKKTIFFLHILSFCGPLDRIKA